jgi:2-dehydro-3-deoxyphosphogluconate aldolase/(4S)-4-hydroxy-2-oxoglutarate aldolase
MNAYEVMQVSPIVPVITIDSVDDALPLAYALLEGGIYIMEITLRTEAGLKSIETISKNIPQMHIGAGTVVNSDGFKRAVDCGSQFVFSPGISKELMQSSLDCKIALIPGVSTASEVMFAFNSGFEHCKLFPAVVSGGVLALKAYSAPFPSMHFCPTGGVDLNNLNDFLALSNVPCVGGSWIVPKEAVKEKNFKHITTLCKDALAVIENVYIHPKSN